MTTSQKLAIVSALHKSVLTLILAGRNLNRESLAQILNGFHLRPAVIRSKSDWLKLNENPCSAAALPLNWPIEVEIGLARLRLADQGKTHVAMIAAPSQAAELESYIPGTTILDFGGFDCVERAPGESIAADAIRFYDEGRRVLVLVPGKREIRLMCREILRLKPGAAVVPMHGEVPKKDRERCFSRETPMVVVATGCSYSGRSIPDISAVVDSGEVRRHFNVGGTVEYRTIPVSTDELDFRKAALSGNDAVYVLRGVPSKEPYCEARAVSQQHLLLSLAASGTVEAPLLHPPSAEALEEARASLVRLGLLNSGGTPTSLGMRACTLPVNEPRYGAMLCRAEELGVVEEVIDCIALFDFSGLWECDGSRINRQDLLSQLRVLRNPADSSNFIEPGRIEKIMGRSADLKRALEGRLKFSSGGGDKAILRAVLAGLLDKLFVRQTDGIHFSPLDDSTSFYTLSGDYEHPLERYVAGMPYQLRSGSREINLWMPFQPEMLLAAGLHILEDTGSEAVCFDLERDCVVRHRFYCFCGEEAGFTVHEVPDHPDPASSLVEALCAQTTVIGTSGRWCLPGCSERLERLRQILEHNGRVSLRLGIDLNARLREDRFPVYGSRLADHYRAALKGARSLGEADLEALRYTIPAEAVAEIKARFPDTKEVAGHSIAILYNQYSTHYLVLSSEQEAAGVRKLITEADKVLVNGETAGVTTQWELDNPLPNLDGLF